MLIFTFQMGTKLFSILLSSIILIQSFNIHFNDFCKLNELVEHIQYHADNYGDDIFTFFSKHYGELREKHNENHQKEDHNQLPFDHDYSINHVTVYILQKIKITQISKIYTSKKSKFFYQENYSSLDETDIFQPPKIV